MVKIPDLDAPARCQKAEGVDTGECYVPECDYWEVLLKDKERLARVAHLGGCARKSVE